MVSIVSTLKGLSAVLNLPECHAIAAGERARDLGKVEDKESWGMDNHLCLDDDFEGCILCTSSDEVSALEGTVAGIFSKEIDLYSR